MTVHLVAEELRTRGCPVEHLHFWDDYDRLRKIPTGVPEEFARHLGRPLPMYPIHSESMHPMQTAILATSPAALSNWALCRAIYANP